MTAKEMLAVFSGDQVPALNLWQAVFPAWRRRTGGIQETSFPVLQSLPALSGFPSLAGPAAGAAEDPTGPGRRTVGLARTAENAGRTVPGFQISQGAENLLLGTKNPWLRTENSPLWQGNPLLRTETSGGVLPAANRVRESLSLWREETGGTSGESLAGSGNTAYRKLRMGDISETAALLSGLREQAGKSGSIDAEWIFAELERRLAIELGAG